MDATLALIRSNTPLVRDEDEDERPGRILTEREFARRVAARTDLFGDEHEWRVSRITMLSLMLGTGMGALMASYQYEPVDPDFYPDRDEPTSTGPIRVLGPVDRDPAVVPPRPQPNLAQRSLTPPRQSRIHRRGDGTRYSPGGDPRERVTRSGVLGIISGRVTGRTVSNASLDGLGGYATGLDAVLRGRMGMRSGGLAGVGRRGVTGIGFAPGSGPNAGGEIGIEDIIGDIGRSEPIALKPITRSPVRVEPLGTSFGRPIIGGRSRGEILRVVNQNLGALRHAYTMRLRQVPELRGKITVKFAIDEFGNVVGCLVSQSTVHDEALEQVVVEKIRRWKFDRIDKPGDITEVVYPFVFSR